MRSVTAELSDGCRPLTMPAVCAAVKWLCGAGVTRLVVVFMPTLPPADAEITIGLPLLCGLIY